MTPHCNPCRFLINWMTSVPGIRYGGEYPVTIRVEKLRFYRSLVES